MPITVSLSESPSVNIRLKLIRQEDSSPETNVSDSDPSKETDERTASLKETISDSSDPDSKENERASPIAIASDVLSVFNRSTIGESPKEATS